MDPLEISPAVADPRQATADRYYAEGCEQVERCDELWARANDLTRDAVDRAAARHDYEVGAARARSLFKRHDAVLHAIACAATREQSSDGGA